MPHRDVTAGFTVDRADFWAGDGDDTVTIGDRFATGRGWGGRGDDTFYLPDVFLDAKYYGGLGNDIMIATPEAQATDNTNNGDMFLYGGAGDDKIEGVHLADT